MYLDKFSFTGTEYFGSVRAIEGYIQSKKDDLEALGYTIMHLIDEFAVPWRGVPTREIMNEIKISIIKG